ncbi:MAG: histidine phosphatase family protein [Eubacteriaceae bacterium]
MRFIFVRHPQTVSNVQRRLTGVGNSPYTEEGVRQAEAIIKFLSTAAYDRIYSSPIERALHIGKSVSENLEAELEIVTWLQEINFGDLEGLCDADFEEKGIKIEEYRNNFKNRFPNGESWHEFYELKKENIEEIKNEEGVCLCTSHGGAIWALSNALLGSELGDFQGLFLNNASIIIIDYDNGIGKIVKRIDIDDIMQGKETIFNYLE